MLQTLCLNGRIGSLSPDGFAPQSVPRIARGLALPASSQATTDNVGRCSVSKGVFAVRTLSISDLDSFLEHGFHLAERHRHFVSLTMIGVTEPVDLWRLLSGATRESDLYFRIDDTLGVLLMSETDCAGAQTAAARLRERCGADFDVRAAIGTYPADNYSAPEFVTMVRRRMQLAQSSERGCVVSSG